ncbi:probable ubiquitin-conjugating enzyme E2 23 [Nicotiana tomentosiformis]|uniref:probable ubiquitin-conjugating enzyme E2 23 n=1 Tax=Nicotiana tomentosiformis TaxID=4098 RepID=UPI00051BBB04|nr:probable ubiquitin-conjugating enzyme E2 23 isoform X1 [Nicotiana tomentosiformis]
MESGQDQDCGDYKCDPITAEECKILADVVAGREFVCGNEVVLGDVVASASNPKVQLGQVVSIREYVDLVRYGSGPIGNVPSIKLQRVRELQVGDYVLCGAYLGKIRRVLNDIRVRFDDDTVRTIKEANTYTLTPDSLNKEDSGLHYYYTGERVKTWKDHMFYPRIADKFGTIVAVTAGSVLVDWITSAGDPSVRQDPPSVREDPKKLKKFTCFSHLNWKIGDWCLVPSLPAVSSSLVSRKPDKRPWTLERMMDVMLKRNSHRLAEYLVKKRLLEKELRIFNVRTYVDVEWQDGKIERNLEPASLLPIENPGENDFFPEDYVKEKAADDVRRRIGVVKTVNAEEQTAIVRWLKPDTRLKDLIIEFEKEEVLSVYQLSAFGCGYGDFVVGLSPVSVPEKVGDTCYPWGNVTGLKDGNIEVTWVDGKKSMVGPYAVGVIDLDDDDESTAAEGSEVSDDESIENDNEAGDGEGGKGSKEKESVNASNTLFTS